jgi:TonB family protein
VLCSALLHVAAIALVLVLTTGHPPPLDVVRQAIFTRDTLYTPLVRTGPAGSGGGGGQRSITPPSKGRPPKSAPRVFTPPVSLIRESEPLLPVEPTILATQALPSIDLAAFGDPHGTGGPDSGGPGSGGGYGRGDGGGIGDGSGPYAGAGGTGPGGSGGPKGLTTNPVLLLKKEPDYSEEARKTRVQGTVALVVEIDARGVPQNIRVQQGLGFGLDERAVEAVRSWRFRPATRNGRPVPSGARIDVSFRLL